MEELARQARAEASASSTDEVLQQFIRDSIKAYGNIGRFGNMLYTIDYDSVFQSYAERIGKDNLTTAEKQQAILNAVLEQAQ